MSNAASDLSITFDLLPHPIHAASAYVRWLLLGATRFRTFLDCSIAQLRDVLVQKVIQQLALAAVALTLSRAQADACVHNGFVGDSVDPRHIKITFQGILLRDDVILQVSSSLKSPAHRFCLLLVCFSFAAMPTIHIFERRICFHILERRICFRLLAATISSHAFYFDRSSLTCGRQCRRRPRRCSSSRFIFALPAKCGVSGSSSCSQRFRPSSGGRCMRYGPNPRRISFMTRSRGGCCLATHSINKRRDAVEQEPQPHAALACVVCAWAPRASGHHCSPFAAASPPVA
jgi:hypothetical protein